MPLGNLSRPAGLQAGYDAAWLRLLRQQYCSRYGIRPCERHRDSQRSPKAQRWTAPAWGGWVPAPATGLARVTSAPAPGTALAAGAVTPASTASTPHDAPAPAPAAPLAPPAAAPAAPAPAGPALPRDLLLGDVRVVLVAPKHEANIGAVARAAANFECLNLYIVAPRCDGAAAGWRGEARKVACGDAVLDRAVVVDTLEQALADTASSIGFTRRTGAARRTHASLGHLLAEFPFALPLQPPPAVTGAAGTTALVFGREESGLTEAELRLCSHASAIPTGRVQPSMNLSHAVSAVLAEVFSRRCGLLAVDSAAAVDEAAAAVDEAASSSGGGSGSGSRQLLRMPAGGAAAVGRPLPASPPGATAAAAIAAAGRVGGRYGGGAGDAGDGSAAGPGPGSGPDAPDAGTLPASAQEVELLLLKVAAIAEAVGMSGAESKGGGNNGNHGRRRLPLGHLRGVVSRARVNAAESRSLHGLASAVLQALDPDHPLEARKAAQRRQQQPQQPPHPHPQQQQQQQQPMSSTDKGRGNEQEKEQGGGQERQGQVREEGKVE